MNYLLMLTDYTTFQSKILNCLIILIWKFLNSLKRIQLLLMIQLVASGRYDSNIELLQFRYHSARYIALIVSYSTDTYGRGILQNVMRKNRL